MSEFCHHWGWIVFVLTYLAIGLYWGVIGAAAAGWDGEWR